MSHVIIPFLISWTPARAYFRASDKNRQNNGKSNLHNYLIWAFKNEKSYWKIILDTLYYKEVLSSISHNLSSRRRISGHVLHFGNWEGKKGIERKSREWVILTKEEIEKWWGITSSTLLHNTEFVYVVKEISHSYKSDYRNCT